MITTLTGPNSYLIKQKIGKIVIAFTKENGKLNIEKVDGEDKDFNSISEALSGLSLFSSSKLIILQKPSAQKQFTENFEKIIKTIPDSTEVVIVEPKLDKRLSYYKVLKAKTEYVECHNLETNELAKWLTEQAKTYGSAITIGDARYLIDRVGQDQMNLDSEIRKLATHSPSQISRQDIEKLTVRSPQSKIFELIEAAMQGKVGRALELYDEQRQQLVEPQQIIAMLAWQLHILALVLAAKGKSAQEISSEAKINPFVVGKTQDLARHIDLNRTRVLIKELMEIDIDMKSTSINADEALKTYIVSLGQADAL